MSQILADTLLGLFSARRYINWGNCEWKGNPTTNVSSVMLRVTPIYGSQWSAGGSAEEPTCTLVEYGDCRILLNVGWIHQPDVGATTQQQQHQQQPAEFPWLPDHDCVLLTDSTLQSMGGLPLYYQQQQQKQEERRQERRRQKGSEPVPSNATSSSAHADEDEDHLGEAAWLPPIYATFPIVKMGQMTLYDYHATICLDGGRPPFTLSLIDNAIAAIQSIKYSQPILLSPSLSTNSSVPANNSSNATAAATLTVMAHRAGHCVGGSFFVLQRVQDETTVVLTKTYYMGKELHLDSSTLLKHATTPDVLVTYPGGPAMAPFKALALPASSNNTTTTTSSGKKAVAPPLLAVPQLVAQVERHLTESVMAVLRRNGNVLFPVDAASRSLELVLQLNRHWERQRLQAAYNLVWLGPMVQNTMEFAKSQLEWMSQSLLSSTNSSNKKDGAKDASSSSSSSLFLQCKALRICSTLSQVESLMQQNPTCIVATGLTLEHGPARNVFLRLADNPDNAIFFTDSSQALPRRRRQQRLPKPEGSAMETVPSMDPRNDLDGKIPMTTDTAASLATHSDRDGPAVVQDDENGNPSQQLPQETTTAAAEEDDEDGVGGDGENPFFALESGGASSNSSSKLVVLHNPQQTASPWNTAAQLLRAWGQAKAQGKEEMDDSIWIDVPVPKRMPLAGAELKSFWATEEEARLQRIQWQRQQAMLREVELAKGQLRLGEDDAGGTATTTTSSGDALGTTSSSSATTANKGRSPGKTSALTTRPRKKSRFDQSLFLKFSKPLHCKSKYVH